MTDTLQRFSFENADIRGMIVKLDKSLADIMSQHCYPKAIEALLGDMLMAATMMFSTLKFEGRLILQIQNEGPIKLLVAKCNNELQISGVVQWNDDANLDDLNQSLNKGQLVVTLINDKQVQPYQSIIPLDQESISQALEAYFAQSEQLPTKFWFAHQDGQCCGLLLQLLPNSDNTSTQDFYMETAKFAGLDITEHFFEKTNQDLLQQLFPNHDLRLYDTRDIHFGCECSTERMKNAIRTLGKKEANAILDENPSIEVKCEFCSNQYLFNRDDVDAIFNPKDDTNAR